MPDGDHGGHKDTYFYLLGHKMITTKCAPNLTMIFPFVRNHFHPEHFLLKLNVILPIYSIIHQDLSDTYTDAHTISKVGVSALR